MKFMKTAVLLTLCVLVPTLSMKCGQPPTCLCIRWMSIVSCYGKDVMTFPKFSEDIVHSAGHIDIINTSMRYLPSFFNWTRLTTIDICIRDNHKDICPFALALQETHYVTTDCDDNLHPILPDKPIQDEEKINTRLPWLSVFVVIPIVAMIIIWRWKFLSLKVTPSYDIVTSAK